MNAKHQTRKRQMQNPVSGLPTTGINEGFFCVFRLTFFILRLKT
jgi:hypothetical protein